MFDEYVPDLDAYLEAWQKVAICTAEKQELENRLEEIVAKIYLDCTNNVAYYIGGKPPAVSLVKDSYAKIGHNTETTNLLGEIKATLIDLEHKITIARSLIKIEEMKLNLYQTMSANARNITGGKYGE
jgi:hypothetical protein